MERRAQDGRVLPLVVGIVLVVAAFAWWRLGGTPVEAHVLERGTVVAEVFGTGTLEARVQTTIGPDVSGRIEEVLADQGDVVVAGQVLVRLDDAEQRRQLDVAVADVEAAQAALDRLAADRERTRIVLEQARKDTPRSRALFASADISENELERTLESEDVAEAEMAAADAALAEGRKVLSSAESTREYRRVQLDDTVLTAPFDGLIVRRDREAGDVVVPGSSVLELASTREVWVSAWVDETEMARLQTGQAARVVFRSEAASTFPGEVARLGREVDRETREFVVDVRVIEMPRNWAVGQRAEVHVRTGAVDDVVVLPLRFLAWRDERPGAWVAEDGRARWRDLQAGLRGAESVAVEDGLSAGETVLAPTGTERLVEDGRISVR